VRDGERDDDARGEVYDLTRRAAVQEPDLNQDYGNDEGRERHSLL
jgi:hypothetical protein